MKVAHATLGALIALVSLMLASGSLAPILFT
jgi:hypothetical protein